MVSYSNDIRFIISNIMYHDIMSSTFSTRLVFDLESYELLLKKKKLLDDESYGLDSLQGCMLEVYLVIAGLQQEYLS